MNKMNKIKEIKRKRKMCGGGCVMKSGMVVVLIWMVELEKERKQRI
jgi:hypothetical protein